MRSDKILYFQSTFRICDVNRQYVIVRDIYNQTWIPEAIIYDILWNINPQVSYSKTLLSDRLTNLDDFKLVINNLNQEDRLDLI